MEWPFPSAFSHTEGSGLLAGGASLWTDFVYDDHGPAGSQVGVRESSNEGSSAPVHGGFVYPAGAAHKNGADIFTAGVGYTPEATYWRVDWNTLADKGVPIAEWTFSTEESAPAPAEAWPGNAGVKSAGIQYALIVSAQHAQLLDVATGLPVAGADLQTEVNMAAKSFIVRIPTSVLPVSGTWKVRLASGLANSDGTGFEKVELQNGGTGSGVNVYNATFRSYKQESPRVCPTEVLPNEGLFKTAESGLAAEGEEEDSSVPSKHVPTVECGNFWLENDQANKLASEDVSEYSLPVKWSDLNAKVETPEPKPTGYSNRWYATPLSFGEEGVVPSEGDGTYTGPTFLGKVQPYAVYVPTNYDPSTPTPLSWILHSLSANLNQYGGVASSQLKEECEERHSICATPESFSEGQWYYGAAQVDFWDVWHALASAYDLNPDATVISGYSMGGFGSYKLGLEYPDLFAQAMALEGPVVCGQRAGGPINAPAGAGQCTSAGNSTPLIVNGKWIPYVMTYGLTDELVPVTGGVEQVEAFDKLNYRYYAVEGTQDHEAYAVENNFAPAVKQLSHLERVRDPASFTFTWYPELVSSALGIGPTGDYWISDLRAAESNAGERATVSASSAALPEPEETYERHTEGTVEDPLTPLIKSLTWITGQTPALQQSLQLNLTDVAALSVDTVAAGLKCATITTTSQVPTTLTLLRLSAQSAVTENGVTVASASSDGTAIVGLHPGTSTLALCAAASQTPGSTAPSGGSSPSAGSPSQGSSSSSSGGSGASGAAAPSGSKKGSKGAHHSKHPLKRCSSRHRFSFFLANAATRDVVTIQVYVKHRLVKTVHGSRLSSVLVNMNGIPKGTVMVTLVAHQSDADVLHFKYAYHKCVARIQAPKHRA